MAAFDRLTASEFDTLRAAGNTWPLSICVVDETMYVLDARRKIYAYNVTSKAYDRAKDFDTLDAAGNTDPRGIWSDGVTMYVSDGAQHKVFAYNASSKARDAAKDIALLNVDDVAPNARGIFGNARTIFVVYSGIQRVVAYDRVTLARVELQDILSSAVPTAEDELFDVWGNDAIVWVGDAADSVLYAFDLTDNRRVAALDFTVLRSRIAGRDVAGNVIKTSTVQSVNPAGLGWNGRSFLLLSNTPGKAGGEIFGLKPGGTAQVSDNVLASELARPPSGLRATDISVEGTTMPQPGNLETTILAADARNRRIVRFTGGSYHNIAVTQANIDSAFDGTPLLAGVAYGNGTTYVADQRTLSIRGFTTGVNDDSKAVPSSALRSANPSMEIQGIMWDGEAVMVLDSNANAVWGFVDGARSSEKDISAESMRAASASLVPAGIATDGKNIFIVDRSSAAIYAFKSPSSALERDTSKDIPAATVGTAGSIGALAANGNDLYAGLGANVRAFTYGNPVSIEPSSDYTLNTDDLNGANDGFNPAGLTFDGSDYVLVDRTSKGVYGFNYNSTTKAHAQVPAKTIGDELINGVVVRALGGLPDESREQAFLPTGIAWHGLLGEYMLLDNSPVFSTNLSTPRIISFKPDGSGSWTGRALEVKSRSTATFTPGTTHPAITPEYRTHVKQFFGLADDTPDAAVDHLVRVYWSRQPDSNPSWPDGITDYDAERAKYGTWTYGSAGGATNISNAQGICHDGIYTYVLGKSGQQTWVVQAFEIDATNIGHVPTRSTVLADVPGNADLRGIGFDSRGHFYVGDFANNTAYAYDWYWSRSPENDLTSDDVFESSAVAWISDIGTDDAGRLFVSDAYTRAVWAYTRTPATATARAATKDVLATVIGNGAVNISGLTHDGTNLYVGYGSGATAQIRAVAAGARVTSKDVSNSVLTAAGVTRIDGLSWASDTLLVLSANAVYGFKEGVADTKYNIAAADVTSLLGTAAARGIARLGDATFIADNAGDIWCFDDEGENDSPRNIPKSFVNAVMAKIGGLTSSGDSLIAGQDSGRGVYGFEPYRRIQIAQGEVEEPTGFFAADGVMYVCSAGGQGRIYAYEMPVVPEVPYWVNPVSEVYEWAAETAIEPVVVPAVSGGVPDPTYSVLNLPPHSTGGADPGFAFDPATRTLTGESSLASSGTIVVLATNPYGSRRYTIRYRILGFTPPAWSNAVFTPVVWHLNNSVQHTIPAVDAGFPAATYTVVGLPAGFRFDPVTRVVSGVPSVVGTGNIIVTATIGSRTATARLAWSITPTTAVPRAPFWTRTEDHPDTWTQDLAIPELVIPSVDIGSPEPSYQAFNLPAGIVFNTNTRALSGTPESFGTGEIRIVAANQVGSVTFTVHYAIRRSVTPTDPFWETPSRRQEFFGLGSFVRLTVPEVDRGYPVPAYTIEGLPLGLVFDETTRTITGTPTSISAGTITVTATNSRATATWTMPWVVAENPPHWVEDGGPARVFIVGRQITPFRIPRA